MDESLSSRLNVIRLSNFDTRNVTNMSYMFGWCLKLTSLDLSSFDTSKVENMSYMFCWCSSLTSLDLSSFDTSEVTNMDSMFEICSDLTSLNLSGFDTSKTSMFRMFVCCSSLTSLDFSSFDTSEVTNMSSMFYDCSSLTSLDLSSFDTSEVTNMSSMFYGCSSLTSLDLSNFDLSSAINVSDMLNFDRNNSGTGSITRLTMPNVWGNIESLNVKTAKNLFSTEDNSLVVISSGWHVSGSDVNKKYAGITLVYRESDFVIYDTNGGTINSGIIEAYIHGIVTPLPTDVTRTGYTFDGWYSNAIYDSEVGGYVFTGDPVTEISATDTGGKFYLAKWTINKFTVTINANNTEYGSVSATSVVDVPYGTEITVSDNTISINDTTVTATAKEVDGYTITFSSWTNAPITITGAVTITANFTRTADSYTITYILNDGTWTTDYTAPTSYTVEQSVTLPTSANITRTNYQFEGWYEESDFSSSAVTTIAKGSMGNKTYYAKWIPNDGKLKLVINFPADLVETTTYGVVKITYKSGAVKVYTLALKAGKTYTINDLYYGDYEISVVVTKKVNVQIEDSEINGSYTVEITDGQEKAVEINVIKNTEGNKYAVTSN